MREIKFRAWDEEAETMYYSTDYEKCTFCVDDKTGLLRCFVPDIIPATQDEPEHIVGREIQPIMQFTGLHDKSGKELDWWEGDLVKSPEGLICIIEYNPFGGGFYLKNPKHPNGYWYPVYKVRKTWKKVGNIHENPELAEQKDE